MLKIDKQTKLLVNLTKFGLATQFKPYIIS